MENQKLENVLNLALNSTEEERDKSLELNVGYEPISREWELIVKYTGNISCLEEMAENVIELQNEFAIVTVREEKIALLTKCINVDYVEKPKSLFFQVERGKRASCITGVQNPPMSLSGKNVLVAVIDSGIDYENIVFRKSDGTTRIKYLWDQTNNTEYSEEDINQALIEGVRLPTRDISGHGTAVAGIIANIAYESEFLIVKMGVPREEGFPRTTELMRGLDYVVRKAIDLERPIAINISFGNTYGAHDGSGLLERFIEAISNNWKSVICIGVGNEGNSAGHVSGILEDEEEVIIELAVQRNSPTLNVQIWKGYFDEVDILLITPSGIQVGPIQEVLGTQRYNVGNTQILLYYGEPSPFSSDQEIYIDLLPREALIDSGVWKIVLIPRRIVNGEFALWLPSQNSLNEGTGFLFPNEERTITIPATSYGTIAVGAYDDRTMNYADFSGRGPAGPGRRAKPDIVAPGVDIRVPVPGGTFAEVSGTSFATPFAAGGAALLMEWGIVRGNDPFLYGEKVKAYFQRGAKPFPNESEYPNPRVGYGALCVEDSIP